MPKFVIDEDMPRSTGRILAEAGYAVFDIRDYGLRGADDNKIFEFALTKQAVLITGDIGFGNILHFPLGKHFGIVLARFPNEIDTQELNRQLLDKFKDLSEDDFKGNILIIEPGKLRIRKK